MAWYSIPEGYSCVVRQNDTTLYAYKNGMRHVYTVNGLDWEHTSTQTSSTLPNNSVCLTKPQIPSSVLNAGVIVAGFFAIACFSLIYKMLKRTFL